MHQDLSPDQSTLASLQPNQAYELRWRDFRNAPRYQGSHLLTLRRPTRLPEASRKYVHGDPVQMIDWKAFARTDQLIMRVQRDEASARVRVVLDLSETMQWPNEAVFKEIHQRVPTKAEVATRLGLNLAHIHLRMGDFVEVWLAEPRGLPNKLLKPRSPSDIVGQFRRVMDEGFSMNAVANRFTPVPYQDSMVDVVYWVGDGLSHGDIESVLGAGKRAAMIHLLSSLEVDSSWLQNDRCYFDEDLIKKEYQGQMLLSQNNYQNSLQRWLEKFQKRVTQSGATYLQVTEMTAIHHYYKLLGYFG